MTSVTERAQDRAKARGNKSSRTPSEEKAGNQTHAEKNRRPFFIRETSHFGRRLWALGPETQGPVR